MNPIIIPISETKNFLDFLEIKSETKISIEKTDFIKAVSLFRIWREDQTAGNFSAELFKLMCKADYINMRKLLTGFPTETVVYLLWYHSDTEQDFYNRYGNVEIKDVETIIENPTSELCEAVKAAQIRKAIYGAK